MSSSSPAGRPFGVRVEQTGASRAMAADGKDGAIRRRRGHPARRTTAHTLDDLARRSPATRFVVLDLDELTDEVPGAGSASRTCG